MSVASFSSTVPARAALAGNPSDGHGGAVVATVVPSLAATVTAVPSSSLIFAGSAIEFGSVAEVSDWLDGGEFDDAEFDGDEFDGGEFGDEQPLTQAALAALHRHVGANLRSHVFKFSTTIPRSLGLAGSSAIVIATIRAMISAHSTDSWARELVERPELIASLALVAERDVLGIAAGLQDRVVQTLGGTVAMEFGAEYMGTMHGLDVGSYRQLGPLPGELVVAYRPGTSVDSGLVHAGADQLADGFGFAMARAADAARDAADAIDCADLEALGEAMDATFDARAAAFPLDPAHVEMITVARSNGASANYTGSGGSIIVLASDRRAAAALGELGCTIVAL